MPLLLGVAALLTSRCISARGDDVVIPARNLTVSPRAIPPAPSAFRDVREEAATLAGELRKLRAALMHRMVTRQNAAAARTYLSRLDAIEGEVVRFIAQPGSAEFRICEVRTDGSGLRQLTFDPHGILCDGPDVLTTTLLHRMDRDGRNLQQLSWGPLSESAPSITNDGRILYTRREYVARRLIVPSTRAA